MSVSAQGSSKKAGDKQGAGDKSSGGVSGLGGAGRSSDPVAVLNAKLSTERQRRMAIEAQLAATVASLRNAEVRERARVSGCVAVCLCA